MRKSRVREIRRQEIANPEGMSSATFRAAKRRHSHGINRVPQPKPFAPIGHPGFPTNTVQVIRTWVEDQPRVKELHVSGKGDKKKVVQYNRRKKVTRVVSLKPVTQTNLKPKKK